MHENLYKSPESVDAPPPEIEVPDAIQKKIRNAWVAAIVSGCLTLVFSVVAIATGSSFSIFSAWTLLDVVLIFALAFGIYRRNRFAAVAMLVYFLISKINMIAQTGSATGIPMAIVFAVLYAQGISGVFAYHKLADARMNR